MVINKVLLVDVGILELLQYMLMMLKDQSGVILNISSCPQIPRAEPNQHELILQSIYVIPLIINVLINNYDSSYTHVYMVVGFV